VDNYCEYPINVELKYFRLITKEDVNERTELKINKLTYHVDNEEISPTKKPGERLLSYILQY
jgi:hypothetical protein